MPKKNHNDQYLLERPGVPRRVPLRLHEIDISDVGFAFSCITYILGQKGVYDNSEIQEVTQDTITKLWFPDSLIPGMVSYAKEVKEILNRTSLEIEEKEEYMDYSHEFSEISYPISDKNLSKLDFGGKKTCKLLKNLEEKELSPIKYQNYTKILSTEIEHYKFAIDEVSNILFYCGDEQTKKMKLRKDLKEYLWIKTLKYFLLEKIENPATFEEIYEWVMKDEPPGDIKNTVQSWVSELRKRFGNNLDWLLTPVEGVGYDVAETKPLFCIFEIIQ
jgi:hypothetical protein